MIPAEDPKKEEDLDDIPEFLRESAQKPRKPPEPPKSAIPAASIEKGPATMNTQTSESPKTQPKPTKPASKAKGRIGVPPPRVRTSIVKPTKPASKAGPKALAKAKAKPAKATKGKAPAKRPGTKLALITALLLRSGGCTGAEVKAACEWPSVSMPQQAEAAGLKLRIEKKPGEPTRYYGKK